MRHVRRYRKLGRDTPHRRSMLRNLATSFFIHGRIVTTLHRAKELQPIVEKLITQSLKAHRGDLGARRKVMNYLHGTSTPLKFFQSLASYKGEHKGGLTRVVRLTELRKGDSATLAVLMATEAVTDPAAYARELRKRRDRNKFLRATLGVAPSNTVAAADSAEFKAADEAPSAVTVKSDVPSSAVQDNIKQDNAEDSSTAAATNTNIQATEASDSVAQSQDLATLSSSIFDAEEVSTTKEENPEVDSEPSTSSQKPTPEGASS